MTTLLIISFITMWGYIAYYLSKVGVLSSHSNSYFALKPYKQSWMFYASMTITAFTLLPVALELTPEPLQILAFLTCAPIAAVAAAANYKGDTMESKVHFTSATIAGIASMMWAVYMAYSYSCWLLVFVAVLGLIAYLANLKWRSPMLWLEYWLFSYPYVIMAIILMFNLQKR
jgi:hypothetical protein